MADFDPQAWADTQADNFDAEKWANEQLDAEAPSVRPAAPKSGPPSFLDSLGGGAAQGFTAKFGDEIQGLVQSVGDRVMGYGQEPATGGESLSDSYFRERDSARALDDRRYAAHPKAFVGGEIGGAIPGLFAAPAAKAGQGLMAMLKAGAGGGALVGALTGVGGSKADPMIDGDNAAADLLDSSAGGALWGVGGALGLGALSKLGQRFTSAGAMNAALSHMAQEEGIANQAVQDAQRVVGTGNRVPLQAVENPQNRLTLQKLFKRPEISRSSGEGEALVQGSVKGADKANSEAAQGFRDSELALEGEKAAYRNTLRESRNAQKVSEHGATSQYKDAEYARSVRGVDRKNQHLTDQEERVQAIKEARTTRNQELGNLRDAHPELDEALRTTNVKELPRMLDKHLGPEGEPVRADLDTAYENLTRAREPVPKPRAERPTAPAKTTPYQEPPSKSLDAARQNRLTSKQKVETTKEATQHIYDTAADLEKHMARVRGAKQTLGDFLSPVKNLKRVVGKTWLDNRTVKKILSDPDKYNQFMDLAATGKRLKLDTSEAEAFGANMAAFISSLQDGQSE